MRRIAPTLILVVLSMGCAHTVQYKLTEADRWKGEPIDAVLKVQTLNDKTVPVTEKEFKSEGYTWRTNFRDGYKDKEIVHGVTRMVVEQLRYSHLFKDVVDESSSSNADYILSGNIDEYLAQGRANIGAETGVIAGSVVGSFVGMGIAMIATSGEKSEVHAEVTLGDLQLQDASTTNLVWQNTINEGTNFVGHWLAGDTAKVFDHADNCLKTAVSELIRQLAEKLEHNSTPAPKQ
jgi:hypothetical protein